MRHIPLVTKGYSAIVDDADYDYLSQFRWYALKKKETRTVYAVADIESKRISMHRLILAPPSCLEIDHINGDGLDNQRKNLRPATRQQNSCNLQRAPRNNKSGYKGVFQVENGKWRAVVKAHGKNHYLGRYATAQQAAEAYNEAAKLYHGEFASLNGKREHRLKWERL